MIYRKQSQPRLPSHQACVVSQIGEEPFIDTIRIDRGLAGCGGPTVRSRSKMLKGSGFLLLLVLAVSNVPGFTQDRESRPTDSGATFAMGDSSTGQSLDRCDPGKKRALVLSGGGLKGAFQAGATYHFIVHRHCDFREIAGVSVGSLNAVILAQAERDENQEASLKNMAERAEKLVDVWQNIRSSKQILKPRWPGWMWALAMRYGVFGTESINSFDPLMHLIQSNVDMDALSRGRPVRVGSVSLWDGTYQEVGPSATFPNNDRKYFLQYVYASALIPVIGKMPRIQQSEQDTDAKQWIQYGDGAILNNTPIFNYFRKCEPQDSQRQGEGEPPCLAWLRPGTPPPQDVQQLFVVVTSPFTKNVDRYPVEPELLAHGSKQVTDGRKILLRTIDLILETDYRDDLTLMLESNAVLAWRKRIYDAMMTALTPEQRKPFDVTFAEINRAFPFHSYNEAPDGGPSLPYDLAVVAPEKVYAESFDLDPENIALQLHYGCLGADLMMQKDFHMNSMEGKCQERFPLPTPKPAHH
jgi:predicted acylesterase/phospholipase RssA